MLDHIISWAALLFSGIALIVSIRVHRRQALLIEKQIAEHERSARQRVQAEVTVALVRQDSWAGRGADNRIVITNTGHAEAREVNLLFIGGNSPVPADEAEEKLPVRVLQPGGTVSLLAAISRDCRPPFTVRLEWRDGSGDRSREATLS